MNADRARAGAARPTVGFISTWPVYWGTTIDRHAHALMEGIRAAARERRLRPDAGCRDERPRRRRGRPDHVARPGSGHGLRAGRPLEHGRPDHRPGRPLGRPVAVCRGPPRVGLSAGLHDARGARTTGRRRQRAAGSPRPSITSSSTAIGRSPTSPESRGAAATAPSGCARSARRWPTWVWRWTID